MALKNTYTKMGAGYHLQRAQDAIMKVGATGIETAFSEGRITGIAFAISLNGNQIKFKIPVNWENFQKVLRLEKNPRSKDDDYCYRVAWACTADWIEAQMAFIESENVTVTQVFLPYAVTRNGETLFEQVAKNPQFLLGSGE